MKKITPNGKLIKEIRQQRTEGALQKEMAFAVRVSLRQLRLIENSNHPITVPILERIASYLAVPKEQIAFAIDAPRLVPPASANVVSLFSERDKERLIPRHDEENAHASMDQDQLFKDASNSHDLKAHIDTKLNDETASYVQELTGILSSLTWGERDILEDIPATEEAALCRRIRELLVLLKGNDVWLYQAQHFRSLPERDTLPPEGERRTTQMRLVIGFGPPGEYGEVTRMVPVDNGQPYILPAWDKFIQGLK